MDSVYIGDSVHRKGSQFLHAADFVRHALILGKSGMGKSRLLENICIQKIQHGEGLCFIDPHGSSARRLLEFIPIERTQDVIYFNPADRAKPIGLNLFEQVDREQRARISDEIVRLFRHIYGASWGVRLQQILYNVTAALLEHGRLSVLAVEPMLNDAEFRTRVLRRVHDPVTLRYWRHQFGEYDKRFRIEATASVHNKVGQFVANPWVRNIVGQVRSTIDFVEAMDNRKIIIANLAKGINGADTASLLGSMIVTKILTTAMAREAYPDRDYVPFTLVADEFHNFGTDSFSELVTEARKYQLGLVAAGQYLEQTSEAVQKALVGAAGTLMAFRVGGNDADALAKELDCQPGVLRELDPFEVRLKRGYDVTGITVKTVAEVGDCWQRSGAVMAQSRWQFGRQRHWIEQKIAGFYAGLAH